MLALYSLNLENEKNSMANSYLEGWRREGGTTNQMQSGKGGSLEEY